MISDEVNPKVAAVSKVSETARPAHIEHYVRVYTHRANVAASATAPLLLIITATRARVAASTSDRSALDRRRRWLLSFSF